jgi:hypothetical protein
LKIWRCRQQVWGGCCSNETHSGGATAADQTGLLLQQKDIVNKQSKKSMFCDEKNFSNKFKTHFDNLTNSSE